MKVVIFGLNVIIKMVKEKENVLDIMKVVILNSNIIIKMAKKMK
jgi:hypothetical protein